MTSHRCSVRGQETCVSSWDTSLVFAEDESAGGQRRRHLVRLSFCALETTRSSMCVGPVCDAYILRSRPGLEQFKLPHTF